MHPLERLEGWIEALKAAEQWREPVTMLDLEAGQGEGAIRRPQGIDVRSNDYLGLASGGVSRETGGVRELRGTPIGAGASRLISGTHREHLALERELAEWLGFESALLFASAYAANTGTIAALARPGDTIFSDALNHASIIDGCRLSRAEVVVVPSGDLGFLEKGLDARASQRASSWVVTESYFGMDGSVPDLAALRALCDRYSAGLIVDEVHALGVFGVHGRGLCAAAGVAPDVLIGGFGKAFGLWGGFAAGRSVIRDWLWNRARPFVFSTAPGPALAAVARARLAEIIGAEAARRNLRELERAFTERLRRAGVPLPPDHRGPVFPIVFGGERETRGAAEKLARAGVRCHPVRPPTVPSGTSRLRISLRADMGLDEVDYLAKALIEVWSACAERRQRQIHEGAVHAPPDLAEAMPRESRAVTSVPNRGTTSLGSETGTGVRQFQQQSVRPAADHSNVSPVTEPVTTSGDAGDRGQLAESGRMGGCAADPPQRGEDSSRAFLGESAVSRGRPRPVESGGPWGPGEGQERGRSVVSGLPRRWVVLGSGTGVGKTFVSVSLARAISGSGRSVAALKPIETGVEMTAVDAEALRAASFHVKHPSPHPLYAFQNPVTPALAARVARQTIELEEIERWLSCAQSTEPQDTPVLVIETAGGVFSPLGPNLTNFDLARKLDPALWLLVAPDRLGVLHEVISSVRAMRSAGRPPDCIVLSAPAEPDASTGTNRGELEAYGLNIPVLTVPRNEPEPLRALVAEVGAAIR